MARDIRVIHAHEFLSAKEDGRVDVQQSLRFLREVVDALQETKAFNLLVDTRSAASSLTAAELWYLADSATQHPRLQACKVCIVCPEERFDYASFHALCAGRSGIDMQAFVSYEEAMTWLWQ
jgi:hypothetical protein